MPKIFYRRVRHFPKKWHNDCRIFIDFVDCWFCFQLKKSMKKMGGHSNYTKVEISKCIKPQYRLNKS